MVSLFKLFVLCNQSLKLNINANYTFYWSLILDLFSFNKSIDSTSNSNSDKSLQLFKGTLVNLSIFLFLISVKQMNFYESFVDYSEWFLNYLP